MAAVKPAADRSYVVDGGRQYGALAFTDWYFLSSIFIFHAQRYSIRDEMT